jgi:hypothetical protein
MNIKPRNNYLDEEVVVTMTVRELIAIRCISAYASVVHSYELKEVAARLWDKLNDYCKDKPDITEFSKAFK